MKLSFEHLRGDIYGGLTAGIVALPFRGAYTASKFALEGLADTLRLELDGSGISISLIEPGPITSRFRTNSHIMYQRHIDGENSVFRQQYLGMVQRLNKPGPAAPFTLPPEAGFDLRVRGENN